MLEFEILPCCVEHGLGIMTYAPFQQGILTGKYATLDDIPPRRRRTRHFSSRREGTRHGQEGAEEETAAALSGMRRIAARTGIPMSVLALSWCLSNPAITCTLSGARDEDQLEQNLAALDTPLGPELMDELNAITAPLKDRLGAHPDYFEPAGKSRTY